MRCVMRLMAMGLLLGLAARVSAHSGGTDGMGGHWDNKAKEYHFHSGPLKGQKFPSKNEAEIAYRKAMQSARKVDAKPLREVAPSQRAPVDRTFRDYFRDVWDKVGKPVLGAIGVGAAGLITWRFDRWLKRPSHRGRKRESSKRNIDLKDDQHPSPTSAG